MFRHGNRDTQKEDDMRRHRENNHIQVKGKTNRSLPQPSEGTSTVSTLTLDFQPPEWQDSKFLLFKHQACDASLPLP
jgi:hypothetical protein